MPPSPLLCRRRGVVLLLGLLCLASLANGFLLPHAQAPPSSTAEAAARTTTRLFGILEDVNEAVKQAMKNKEKVGGCGCGDGIWASIIASFTSTW